MTFDVSVDSPQGAPQAPPSVALFTYQPTSLVALAKQAQAREDIAALKRGRRPATSCC